MTLAAGTRLGVYEVASPLGAGGMGEVYRAHDTTLNRDVAIKILPDVFAHDAERVARFTREAQTLAALNHPNIAQIFGIVEAPASAGAGGHVHALVMELVGGEELSARIARGPLPIAEALPIAKQLADALEAAHDQGIVHRDLKPANIKVRPDGTVKVLDFGLAKAFDAGSGVILDPANSPTLTARATQMGMLLGTAAYMAPEQARGKAVDRRADIWAFGVVLYEMLTGRPLFKGDDVSDVLAEVLKTDPDFTQLPADTPSSIRRLLRRCLDKDPRNRLSAIGDARFDLNETAMQEPAEKIRPGRPARARWLPWAIATLASLAAVTAAVVPLRRPGHEPDRVIRFNVVTPESTSQTRRGRGFEVSPDGRYLAIISAGELWVRPLDSVSARRLEGIENATYPFWSPDSEWIGLFTEGQLKKIPRDGGAAQRICDAPDGRGAAWGPDNVIVFSAGQGSHGLSRVSAQGGQPVPVTNVPATEVNQYHRYPQFLPDGRSFLFLFLAPAREVAGVYVGTLDGSRPVRVLDGAEQAFYASSDSPSGTGLLLFRRQNTLMGQPFDSARRQATGEAAPIADGVGSGANTGSGAFAVSHSGILAYSSDWSQSGELVWFDRSGRNLGAVNAESRELQGLSLAQDGRRVAYGAGVPSDVWIQSLPGGEPSRFTFGPAPGWAYPLWSPDGRELAYTSFDLLGFPEYELRVRRTDRGGAEETLLRSKTPMYPWDWSPDGRLLAYSDDQLDLRLLPLSGDHKPEPLITAPGEQAYAQFSPDGRFVAYTSDQQGQPEVLIGTVPSSGAIWQISSGGGSMPRWRRDGRELYYRSIDGTLMVVALGAGVGPGGAGASAIDGRAAPRPLFTGIPSSGNTPIFMYAPADDGQRFLVASSRKTDQPPITVVVNWQAAPGVRDSNGRSR